MLQSSILLIVSAVALAALGYPFGILTRTTPIGVALQYVPWNLSFAALLGLFLWIGTSRWKAIVAPSPLMFFGKISYGLYLYHHLLTFQGFQWFALRSNFNERLNLSLWEQVWARMLLAGTASILMAFLSRRYFEEPFLRLKNRLPQREAKNTPDTLPSRKSAAD